MKIVKLVLMVSFVILTMNQARADYAKQKLFDVYSEFKSGATTISAAIDAGSGEIVGLDVQGDFYSASEVKAGTVIKLDGADNSRKPLQIAAPGVDVNTGGSLVLIYLHDGLKGDYRRFPMSLHKDGSAWKVYMPGGNQPITSLFMTKNTLPVVGKVIGIGDIKPSF